MPTSSRCSRPYADDMPSAADLVTALARPILDFPKPGIRFLDITPVLADGPALAAGSRGTPAPAVASYADASLLAFAPAELLRKTAAPRHAGRDGGLLGQAVRDRGRVREIPERARAASRRNTPHDRVPPKQRSVPEPLQDHRGHRQVGYDSRTDRQPRL